MAGTAQVIKIFSGTCDPSTISPLESQIFKLGGTAHGEERHTLAKLRTLYLQVAESVNAVTKEVGSMQFAWASRLEELQSRHTEADRMHIHMKIDLEQEENRYKQARSDAESMRASLPPDGVVLEGAQWSNYLIYRRKNMKIREGDAEKSAERLESLKEQLRQQGEQVDQLDRDIVPVISVCSHLTRAADVFQDITAKVLQEGEHILSRMGSAIANLDSSSWGVIFTFAIASTNRDNALMVHQRRWDEIISPIKIAFSLAHVNQRWRQIMFSADMKHLWSHWAIDIGRPTFKLPKQHQFPAATRETSVQLLLYSSDPEIHSVPSKILMALLVYLRGIKSSHLTLGYRSMQPTELKKLFPGTQGTELTSLHLVGESQPPMGVAIIPSPMTRFLQELCLSDMHSPIQTPQFSSLRILRIIISYVPTFTDRTTTEKLRELVYNSPLLTDLDVDLGFNDNPRFSPTPLDNIPCIPNLKHLGLRLSYLQNRLSFILSTSLPRLDSITIFTMPSSEMDSAWSSVKSFFAWGSKGIHITTLRVMDMYETSHGGNPAGDIFTMVPNIRHLEVHYNSLEYFMPSIGSILRVIGSEPQPLRHLSRLVAFGCKIVEKELMETLKQILERQMTHRSSPCIPNTLSAQLESCSVLRAVDIEGCQGISPDTCDAINELLIDYWSSDQFNCDE